MITCKELREISLTFRRLSSNFLNSTDKDASTLIQRFKEYIDNTPFIAELIKKTTQGVEYDYLECFVQKAHGGWSEIRPPVNEACHIKAMYDYLSLIADNGGNVLGAAMSYYHSSNKFRDIIRSFLDSAFKPLIDYINDAISKEMIMLEEEKSPTMTQNIGQVYGTVNQQGSGAINSVTYVHSTEAKEIESLIERIIPSLDAITDIPVDAIDDVRDDLQSIEEQIKSQAPKKNRIQKALAGIKKFMGDFSMKVAVTTAASVVTHADWAALIGKVEEYIAILCT